MNIVRHRKYSTSNYYIMVCKTVDITRVKIPLRGQKLRLFYFFFREGEAFAAVPPLILRAQSNHVSFRESHTQVVEPTLTLAASDPGPSLQTPTCCASFVLLSSLKAHQIFSDLSSYQLFVSVFIISVNLS